MLRNQKMILILLSLIFANYALADRGLNALEDIAITIVIATIIILLFLALIISLLLNFLLIKKKKNFMGTAVGAFTLSLLPTFIHGVGDYNASIFIVVFMSSLIGGLLGYFVTNKLVKS